MRKLKNEELNRPSAEAFREQQKFPLVFVLDNIRSHHNTGSVFRTADAFAVEEIFLCGITPVPPHREIHKTALGATDTVKWRAVEKTIEAIRILKKEGYSIFAIEQAEESIPLQDFHLKKDKKYAFIFGHEVFGVSEEAMVEVDGAIEIPQYGTKHSLNIAVTAGIIAWDFLSKMMNDKR